MFPDDIEQSITEVHHEQEKPTVVNGYQEPGSYVRPINYPIKEREQFDEFVARAYSCEQYIRYKCWNSRLLSDAGNGLKKYENKKKGAQKLRLHVFPVLLV